MRKLLYLIIFLLLISPCYATTDTLEGEELTTSANIEGVTTTDTVEGQVVTAGGVACGSGAAIITQDTQNSTQSLSSNVTGQSFDPGENCYLYSIEVYILHAGDGTLTLRWDDDNNFTGEYLGTKTSATITGSGYVEFVFQDTTNQMLNGTPYYLGVVENSGVFTAQRHSGEPYAGGIYSYGTGWDMDSTASYDLRFKVNKCAP